MGAPSVQDGLDDLLGDGLGVQRVTGKAFEEGGPGVALAHDDGAHLVGLVAGGQLGGEALVEGEGGGLGRRVVDHGGRCEVAGERGDGDDHAVVLLDHVGEELLGEEVVAQRVHVEGKADVVLGRVEDGLAAGAASVVDEHRGVAEGGAHGGRGLDDGRLVGEVAVEVLHRGGRWEGVSRGRATDMSHALPS